MGPPTDAASGIAKYLRSTHYCLHGARGRGPSLPPRGRLGCIICIISNSNTSRLFAARNEKLCRHQGSAHAMAINRLWLLHVQCLRWWEGKIHNRYITMHVYIMGTSLGSDRHRKGEPIRAPGFPAGEKSNNLQSTHSFVCTVQYTA